MDTTPSGAIEPVVITESGDLELAADRLRQIEDAANVVVDRTMPANTRRAFAGDWSVWVEFCQETQVSPYTVSSGLLVAFVTWASTETVRPDGTTRKPAAPATITRRLAGILDGWKRDGQEIPHGITKDARKVVRAYERHVRREGGNRGRGASPALTVPELRLMAAACGNDLPGIRDRAILVIGFSIAARRAILAAMNVADIREEGDDGLVVWIRDDKTGEREVAVPYGSDRLTCPVRTWRDWLAAAGITEGRAFRSVTLGGVMGDHMSGDAINEMIKRRARQAGLGDRGFTAHSMRSGLATESRRAGKDLKVIAEQGGWQPNSPTLYRYFQIVDRFQDNAAKGIGL